MAIGERGGGLSFGSIGIAWLPGMTFSGNSPDACSKGSLSLILPRFP